MNNTKGMNRPNRPMRHEQLLGAQDEGGLGGQHASPIGTSTAHHKCLHDFSLELRNRAALADFEDERKRLSGKREAQRFLEHHKTPHLKKTKPDTS